MSLGVSSHSAFVRFAGQQPTALATYSLKVNANIDPEAFETRLKTWITEQKLNEEIKGVEPIQGMGKLFLFKATPAAFKRLWREFNQDLAWAEKVPPRKLS